MASTSHNNQLFSEYHLRMQKLISYILPQFHALIGDSKQTLTDPNTYLALEHLIDLFYIVCQECKSGTSKKDESSVGYLLQITDHLSALGQYVITKKDFDPIKLIGKGAFGEVHLVRYRGNSEVIQFFNCYYCNLLIILFIQWNIRIADSLWEDQCPYLVFLFRSIMIGHLIWWAVNSALSVHFSVYFVSISGGAN